MFYGKMEDFENIKLENNSLILRCKKNNITTIEIDLEQEGYDSEETAINIMDDMIWGLYYYYEKKFGSKEAKEKIAKLITSSLMDNVDRKFEVTYGQ